MSRLLAMLLLAALAVTAPASAQADPEPQPTGVVALVDTGINPYHRVFRDDSPLAHKHPSTYIRGYPADAVALPLTFDAPDYTQAVRADCDAVWSKVEPGKLYWFPGTKIIGAISFSPRQSVNCATTRVPTGATILDYNGHGTMVASRAASTEYGSCKDCRVVATQFPTSIPLLNPGSSTGPAIDAITWAANNASWIDAQSNSWGPFVPGWDPTGQAGLLTANPALVRAVEEVSRKHLAFWASGNGAAFRLGLVGHPTAATAHFTPSAVMVGGHDSGYVNTWPGFSPHVVSDSCDSLAAKHNHLTESGERVGGGTSAATPFAAGGAAQTLLAARRILGDVDTGVSDGVVARGEPGTVATGPLADGELTVEEWKAVVYKTATPRPERQPEDGPPCATGLYSPTPVLWKDVPRDYPEYVQIGYGAVDRPAMALAQQVLLGEAPTPDRAATDRYFSADATVRNTTHPLFRGP